MEKLNSDFLSHDGPTDVISFGLARASKSSPVIGDIYICPLVAERNARRLGITAKEELTRLVIHGMLHILGHDHPEGDEAPGRRCGNGRRGFLTPSTEKLLAQFGEGKTAALARVVSIVENRRPESDEVLAALHAKLGNARRIGITGPRARARAPSPRSLHVTTGKQA
jgi:rRNA maturation RNase YbeY